MFLRGTSRKAALDDRAADQEADDVSAADADELSGADKRRASLAVGSAFVSALAARATAIFDPIAAPAVFDAIAAAAIVHSVAAVAAFAATAIDISTVAVAIASATTSGSAESGQLTDGPF